MQWITGYYVLANIFLFILMHVDKKRAVQRKWRIRESTLFAVAIFGGALGGLTGMFLFKHKNRKMVFYIVFFCALFSHSALLWYLT